MNLAVFFVVAPDNFCQTARRSNPEDGHFSLAAMRTLNLIVNCANKHEKNSQLKPRSQ
jgi:hypothetical protein